MRKKGSICLLTLALFLPALAVAADFSIDDRTDSIVVAWDPNFDVSGFCVNGSCAGTDVSGSTTVPETSGAITFSGSWIANTGTSGSGTIFWLEQGTTNISDEMSLSWTWSGGIATIAGTFTSDNEASLGTAPSACPDPNIGNCAVLDETGDFQELAGVFAGIGFPSNLTFQVASDVDVPEPSSILLLLGVLLGAVPMLRRRLAA